MHVRLGVALLSLLFKVQCRWRRLTEARSGSAKSVIHFDVQGSVVKSTQAGIPWLRYIRDQLGKRVHLWPFDR